MSETITLKIYEVVGSSLCVASQDGQKVFEQIKQALKDEKKVRISFQNVESLTSAFLNAAIGQLYGFFDNDLLKESMSVTEIEKDDLALLKRVIDTAKQYFKDPAVIESVRKEAMGDDDE
jgi:UDP-N-acetyl-D-mannosaminuronic acid transferase (WecB/TagA/CpsF family)